MLKDLVLFQKCYDLLKWLHGLLAKYPKSERFVLAQKTENAALELIEAVIVANAALEKTPALGRANLALEKLRVWVRLGFELRYASLRQYEHAARRLDELGRLLGGWQRRFAKSAAGKDSRSADGGTR
ncbi:MAG: hypothetical protein COV48_05810 [Elusimicrobia bacterium CG11_big_fil_rev_8_21_14_0_20_64_6]|nr:MAG: hypothetical protein COV48_05810 [Elusimicrobia bacterium CG11_big_fil_rev_8_21_14_0_20_64_6]